MTLALLLVALAVAASATPSRPPGDGQTLTTDDGTTIWYEVRGAGEGRPLVVVNGGPGFDHTYLLVSDVWDRLSEERPVVLYDQRGNGRSSPVGPDEATTLLDQIADLEALRVALDREQIDLLGHSWGGYLVMAYAAAHPQRIAHLLIIDSAAPRWSDTEFIFEYVYPETMERRARLDARAALGDEESQAESLRAYLSMLCVSAERTAELVAAAGDFDVNLRVNEALNADLAQHDLRPLLPTFTMPTLVVTGRFDINVAPSTAWRIHQAIPGSRFVVFEKSGHLPFFEEPASFVATVEGFLGEE